MTQFLLVLAASALLPSGGAAQATIPDTSVRRLLDSARALGLPEAPLRSVVAEGAQRHEPATRVANALRSYIGALQQARTALGARATDAEVDAGASVLLSGANVTTLNAVRAARPSANVTVALVVLADLVDRGVPVGRAEDAVVTLTKVGASDGALKDFRSGVQQDLAAGQNAEASLLKRTREAVTQLQGAPGRKPPPAQLDAAQLLAGGADALASAPASALYVGPGGHEVAAWSLGGTAAPFAAWPLRVRANAAGSVGSITALGQASAEVLATVGTSRPDAGVEAGTGTALFSNQRPAGVVGYAAAWATLKSTRLRVEARVGRAGFGGTTTSDLPIEGGPITRFDRVAFAVSDTPIVTLPPSRTSPPTDSGGTGGIAVAGRALAEYRLGISRRVARVTLDGAVGLRVLGDQPLDSWEAVSVTAPVAARLSLVGGLTMRRPVSDLAAPVRSSLYLGFRWQPHAGGGDVAESAPRPTPWEPAGETSVVDGVAQLAVRLRGAHTVEVSGDFTDWQPVAMESVGRDRWRIALPPDRTIVRLRVRVDGGAWLIPSGLARARTAFGDEVGVILLAARSR